MLGIDAKALRKLIRDDLDNFGVRQVEGKWSFSKSDIARIRSHINSKNSKTVNRPVDSINGSVEELSTEQKRILSRRDARLNREVEARARERVARLEARLRAAGVHLSQHRDTEA